MAGISTHLPNSSAYLRAVPSRLPTPDPEDANKNPFTHSSIERDACVFSDQPNARDFEMLLTSYLWSGGMARSVEVARHLAERQGANHSSLERLLATKAVFAFEWRGSLWLPMFQFDSKEMFVKPASRQVLTALAGVFDSWTIACWFQEPNLWLQSRRPIDLLDVNPMAVVAAARGDRYIATNSLVPAH